MDHAQSHQYVYMYPINWAVLYLHPLFHWYTHLLLILKYLLHFIGITILFKTKEMLGGKQCIRIFSVLICIVSILIH